MSSNLRIIITGSLLLAAAVGALAQTAAKNLLAARVEKEFHQAQAQFKSAPNNSTNAWDFARASSDFCDVATNDTQRAEVAKLGIAACRHLLAREPNSAPGHYYLAMNLGKLAQAEAPSLAAYHLVHEVEREFLQAAALDVRFDHAGPARTLGELYFQAPGWPLSVGSKHKAGEWLERAVALAPDYPGNLINLAEAQLKWREQTEFETTMKNLDARWAAAQTNYTGVAREADWLEWNARRAALKADYRKLYGSKP